MVLINLSLLCTLQALPDSGEVVCCLDKVRSVQVLRAVVVCLKILFSVMCKHSFLPDASVGNMLLFLNSKTISVD